jgi:hypothetical protein
MGDNMKLDNEDSKRPVTCSKHNHGFTDNPWGKRAHEVVQSMWRLKHANWVQIEEHTSAYLQCPDQDNNEGCGGVTILTGKTPDSAVMTTQAGKYH